MGEPVRERVPIREAAAMLGQPPRTVLGWAADGMIPGAAKFGKNWSFDVGQLRNWIRQREAETWQNRRVRMSTSGAGSTGAVSWSKDESIGAVLAQAMQGRRRAGRK